MLRRSTLLTLAVFVVMAAALVVLRLTGAPTNPTQPPAATQAPVFDLGRQPVTQVRVTQTGGASVGYTRGAEGTWTTAEGAGLPATDPSAALETLETWTVANPLPTPPALADAGLAPERYRVELTLADGSRRVLLIGSQTPTGSGYYARLEEGRPFILAAGNISPLLELVAPSPNPAPEGTVTPNGAGG